MAFVNEYVSDADRRAIDFSVIKQAPLNKDPIDPYMWTIDRDRNVFLMRTGSGGADESEVQHVALWLQGQVVPATIRSRYDDRQKELLVWELQNLDVPEHLRARRSDILQLLREALDEYGSFYQ